MKRNDDQNGIKVDGQEIAHGETDQRTLSGVSTGVLRVVVPYTTPELTRTALRHAAVCSDLDVYIALVDIQVVPFPCPLMCLRSTRNTLSAD